MTSTVNQIPSVARVPVAERDDAPNGRLTHLRWAATILPALAVFAYESFRHGYLENHFGLDDAYGNLLTGVVALGFSFLFAHIVFRYVAEIQHDAVERTRAAAALDSMIDERERLSRELHDGLAQVISYLLVRLDTVRNLVEDGRTGAAVAELEALRSAVDNLNVDVRESIAGLRSRVVERGLVEALHDYLDEFEERYGIHTELRLDGPRTATSPNADLQLFRVVQEALTNVRKHASANEVRVGVACGEEGLEIVVADNGTGFEVPGTPSDRAFGMMSMRERAASLGGSCTFTSKPGRGTTITICVPTERRTS
jgi:signal transduction histidine kinase